MQLSSVFGLSTVPHGLIRLSSGELAYITKRLDRKNGKMIFHMEDCCQLMGFLTEFKYRASMEKVGKALSEVVRARLFDVMRFFDMALISFLVGNADMHLKNFSTVIP